MGIVLEGLIPSRNSYPETQYFEGNKLPGKPYFSLHILSGYHRL